MDSLYDNLIEYYDEIFPVDKERITFISEKVATPGKANKTADKRLKVLDVGCATGAFSLALMRQNYDVTGIDNNAAMIQSACRRNPEPRTNARFFRMDMLDISKNFIRECFDVILCLGNTLVHLENKDQVSSFLAQGKQLLSRNGAFIFQIINYEKIVREGITNLPSIESKRARFEREYHKRDDGRLSFEATLYSSSEQAVFRDRVPLLPIKPMEITEMLNEIGYKQIDLYDDFSCESMKGDTLAFVGVAYNE